MPKVLAALVFAEFITESGNSNGEGTRRE